jgi:hypothetical protein
MRKPIGRVARKAVPLKNAKRRRNKSTAFPQNSSDPPFLWECRLIDSTIQRVKVLTSLLESESVESVVLKAYPSAKGVRVGSPSQIETFLAEQIQQLTKKCKLCGGRHPKFPSFIDITYMDPDKKYQDFDLVVQIICILTLRGCFYFECADAKVRNTRYALNDLFLADFLLSKLWNVAKKYYHYGNKSNGDPVSDHVLYLLRITINYHLGDIYAQAFDSDNAYGYFCGIIQGAEDDEREPITQGAPLGRALDNHDFPGLVWYYRQALLKKAKLVIAAGRVPEATKWLVRGLSTLPAEEAPDRPTREIASGYCRYMDSVLYDDVIDKEFLTKKLQETLREFRIRLPGPDAHLNLYYMDILVRLFYCTFIFKPGPRSKDDRGSEWSLGQTTLEFLDLLFEKATEALNAPGLAAMPEAQELRMILARNILHACIWLEDGKGSYLSYVEETREKMEQWAKNVITPNIFSLSRPRSIKNHAATSKHDLLAVELELLSKCSAGSHHRMPAIQSVARKIFIGTTMSKETMESRQRRMHQYLQRRGKVMDWEAIPEDERYPSLCVLRRYNSSSPLIPRPGQEKVRGGGYFLVTMTGKGLVIDPGVNFLRNFYEDGFGIEDIDGILLTHAHVDHTAEVEDILTLVYEYNDRIGTLQADAKPKGIDLMFNVGTMHKMLPWVQSHKEVVRSINSLCRESRKNWSNQYDSEIDLGQSWCLVITAVHAQHDEVIAHDFAVGLILSLRDPAGKKKPWKLGITSDTGYYEGITKVYEGCNPLIVHLGDAYPEEIISRAGFPVSDLKLGPTKTYVEDQEKKYNDLFQGPGADKFHPSHLALGGTVRLIETLAKSKARVDIILSEYPEEMGSYRRIVANAIQQVIEETPQGKDITLLSGDIGLTASIQRDTPVYRCEVCALDNNMRKDLGNLGKYHPARDFTSTCIQSEGERISYRCKAHQVKPKNLWAHSSHYITRCMISAKAARLKGGA